MTELTELEDLLARVAMGDRAALGRLYDRSAPRLHGLCRHMLRDADAAERALQETYRRIWAWAGDYRRDGTSPMAWLLTIARDAALAGRKGQAGDDAPEPRATAPPPAQSAAGRALDAGLAALPAEEAAMIRRAYLGGASYATLAEGSGQDPAALRIALRRALADLRDSLSR